MKHLPFEGNDGVLYGWGLNTSGQLGVNDTTTRTIPNPINWRTFNKIYAHTDYAAGIDTTGNIWLWGANTTGKLGGSSTISKSSPVQVSGGGSWSQLSLNSNYTGGIKTDGSLWFWGTQNTANWGINNTFKKAVNSLGLGISSTSGFSCYFPLLRSFLLEMH